MPTEKLFRQAPMFYVFVSFASGVAVQKFVSIPLAWASWIFFILYIVALLTRRRPVFFSLIILTVLGLGGMVYTQRANTFPQDHIVKSARFYYGKPVHLTGLIVSDVECKETVRGLKTRFIMKLQQIETGSRREQVTGKVLVNVFRETDLIYGDVVNLEGKLHQPFDFKTDGQFSYRQFLRNKQIYYILSVKKSAEINVISHGEGFWIREQALRIRHQIKSLFNQYLTKNEAGIMNAMIIGDRNGVPDHIRDLFVKTGTAHILAISGLHIAMITGMIWGLLKIIRLPRAAQLLGTVILLAGYVLLTGGRPSVLRASIMATIFLSSLLIEREHNLLNTLSLSAVVLLLCNPNVLFDVGFQLSFGCLFSIVLLVPRVEIWISRIPVSFINPYLTRTLSYSLGIWMGTAGMIAYYFRIITPSGIVANLLIIVLLTTVIMLAAAFLLCGFLIPKMAAIFAVCLKAVLNGMVLIAFLFSKIPFSYFFIKELNIWCIIIYHIFL
ncbi:MAG: ComEC family competence protein, partial [Candidatus Omnitrophica bacterium]|nr:ComEC family competence protein [Candidatus Omnitrophota bacterium]